MALLKCCEDNDICGVKQLLLDSDIDVNYSLRNGGKSTFPLNIACGKQYLEIIKLLLAHPDIDINKCSVSRETPLSIACRNGYIDVVKLLVQHHSIMINTTFTDKTPLFHACEHGFTDIVKLLLWQPDININKVDAFGYNCLHIATVNNHIKVVKLLLQQPNVVVNNVNEFGKTCLSIACELGFTNIVKLLLKHPKINVNLLATQGIASDKQSPLHIAFTHRHVETFKVLLKHDDVDVNLPSSNGMTIVKSFVSCYAPSDKHVTMLRSLLKHGKTQAVFTNNAIANNTILQYACEFNNVYIIKKLLMSTGITTGGCIHRLVFAYNDNKDVTKQWTPEIDSIPETFTTIVLLCDNYFKFNSETNKKKTRSFLSICTKLPIELQMLICNLLFDSSKRFVSSKLVNDKVRTILC